MIPAAGSLFVVDAKSVSSTQIEDWTAGPQKNLTLVSPQEDSVPRELKTEVAGPRLDAKFSPDSHLVAFIRHNDLFVCDSNTAQEQRLTYSNKST